MMNQTHLVLVCRALFTLPALMSASYLRRKMPAEQRGSNQQAAMPMGCIVSDMLWGTKMPLPRSDDRSKGQSSTAESIGSYIDAKLAVYKAASRKAARRRDYGAELKRLNCEPLVYQKNVWRTPTVEECAAYEDAAFAALSTSHYTYAANPSAVQPLCGRPAALKLPPREFNLAMGDDRSRSELLKQLNAAHELPDGRRFRAEEAQLRACAAEAENKLTRQKLRHVAGDKRELSRQLRDVEDGTEQLKHVSSLLPCYRCSRVFRTCSGVGCECYFDCADDDCVECWLNVGHEVQRPGRGVTKDEMQPCNRVVVAESSMVVSWMSPLDDRGFPPLGNWKRQSGSRSTRHSSHSRERNI